MEYNRDGYNKSYISSRNYAGENHKFFTVGLRVPNDDIRSIDFLPSVNALVNLGTSTNKWKSFNEINPGALSLPGNYINVDTTNWVLDGSGVNIFTPTSDGWLGIQATDTVYDQMHYVFAGRRGYGAPLVGRKGDQPFFQTVCRPHEVLQAERFEQVVDGIDTEAFDGVFRVGGGEDDERRYGERLDEVHAVEVGHVDVAEDGINRLTVQHVDGFDGTLTLCYQLQERHFPDICG